MTFYLKRPGQYEGKPLTEPRGYELHGSLDAALDEWSLYLPHQCDSWEIAFGTREEVLAEARAFRARLDEAIRVIEAAGNDPAC